MSDDASKKPGPVEVVPWPTDLTAQVVTPGAAPRIFGYDVQRDLALNYSFSELLYLSLTEDLPATRGVTRAFDAALAFLSPASVATAPTHSGVLTRLCGSPTASVLAVTAVGLSQEAQAFVERHLTLRSWLGKPEEMDYPDDLRATNLDDRHAVERLFDAAKLTPSAARHDPSLGAAIFSVLFEIGLTEANQWERAVVTARLPAAWAEALSTKPLAFRDYPMELPKFSYEPPPGESKE